MIDIMQEDKYYKLKRKITNTELFQILKNARRHNWNFSFKTDLDEIGFNNAGHDDIDTRDDFEEIQSRKDPYAVVGFIVVECIEVKSLEIFDGENSTTFFENVIHFNGNTDKFKQILMYLSLNPDYWIKWEDDDHK